MPNKDDKLSAKPSVDTTDFKTGIASMNRELRVLESGFRASAAALGNWANDATGLENRIKTLNSSMDIQKQKVAAVRAEWERVKAENGEDSRAAQDLEIKLNKETETLGKMRNELNTTEGSLQEMQSSSDDAGKSVDELGNKSEDTGGKIDIFNTTVLGIGTVVAGTVGVMLGLASAVAGVGKAITDMVLNAATAGSDLQDMSDKTGISTQRLQEFKFIGNQTGVSLDTITGANARLIRSMAGASDQTDVYNKKLAEAQAAGKGIEDIELGNSAKAFQTLGIAVTDSNGNLRDNQAVFAETLEALGKIENPAERDALAMDLFGKSAQELNPLAKLGTDGMAAMTEKAHELGAVMDDKTVTGLDNFDDTLAGMKDGLMGTLGTLAGAFLPGFQSVLDQGGGYLKTFTDIVSGSDGDFGKMAEGFTGLVTQIATDVAAQAPQMLQAGLGIVKSILSAVTSALPSMLTAAVEIIKTLIDFIVQNLPALIDAGIQIILTLVDALIQNLPMLIDAALQAIITLANGLTDALPTLIPAIVQAIITIVNTLIENLPMLIMAALQLLQALANGLIIALPVLIAAIPQIVNALLSVLIASMPLLWQAGAQILGTLVGGLVAALPVLFVSMDKLLVVVVENLAKLPAKALEAGKAFIKGLIDGIENAKGLLFNAVVNMVSEMVLNIMNALGIQSPSKVGRGIGKNFIGSIALGGEDVMSDVARQFAAMTNRMSLAAAAGMGGGAASVSNSTSNSFDIFGNVIVQGHTTPDSFGAALKGKRY